MTEKICDNIYRISVPLKGNPLKELNSYFIKGDDRDLVIDTGFHWTECLNPLLEGLEELGSNPLKRDVFVTHLHSDHMGNAKDVVGPGRKIYMSKKDLFYVRRRFTDEYKEEYQEEPKGTKDEMLIKEGFTKEMLSELAKVNPAKIYAIPALGDEFVGLDENDKIKVGYFELEMLLTPGHTPGNTMLWDEKHGIMFTGDNILFNITPNITSWPGVKDSLGDYMDNLKKYRDYPVELALPAHRMTGDYKARIDALLLHHEGRLSECYGIVEKNPGLNATEIAGRMTWQIRARNWEEFPLAQKFFAVGECLAHLDYLMVRNKITKELKDGTYIYHVS